MEHQHTEKRIIIGALIILAGLALLLSNLGFISYELKRYVFRWEMILIVIGVIFVMSHDKKGPGIILLIIGGAFYIRDFFELSFSYWQILWPAVLILAGILILLRHRKDPTHYQKKNVSDDDIIDEIAIFGGGDRTIVSQNFSGGKILAIFGGSNFNLTRAKLAPGVNSIEIMAVFGGMKMIVPEGWNIKIKVVSLFGGFSDKHRINPQTTSDSPGSELIIEGFVIFGGGEIKSY
jgi:predicted membrane protein